MHQSEGSIDEVAVQILCLGNWAVERALSVRGPTQEGNLEKILNIPVFGAIIATSMSVMTCMS